MCKCVCMYIIIFIIFACKCTYECMYDSQVLRSTCILCFKHNTYIGICILVWWRIMGGSKEKSVLTFVMYIRSTSH